MSVLVSSESKHGSTGAIARRIARILRRVLSDGTTMNPSPAAEVVRLTSYDAVVLGNAVYIGRWTASTRQVAHPPRRVGCLSSGPIGDQPKTERELADVPAMGTASNIREHRLFASRLDRHRLGSAERAMAVALQVAGSDFRDWHAIDGWARQIAAELCSVDESSRSEHALA